MGSKCSTGHLFHLVRTFAVLLERPKKRKIRHKCCSRGGFLFVCIWLRFVCFELRRKEQRISKDCSELAREGIPAQTCCSIRCALFSILALLTWDCLGYIKVAVFWIFSSTVWWLALLGDFRYSILEDPEEKKIIFILFLLGPSWSPLQIHDVMLSLPISNRTQLSLLRSDPARCLVKRSLKIYFVCCSTAWVTGVNSFAFGIMRVLWLKNDNIEKKGTLGRFLLARVSMFLCLWFHNIWSEHPMCHEGERETNKLNFSWDFSNSVKKRKRCMYANDFLLCHRE